MFGYKKVKVMWITLKNQEDYENILHNKSRHFCTSLSCTQNENCQP